MAIIPQPISTSTTDGVIAPSAGMTDPTMAPMPTCASAISATWPGTNGMRVACSMAPGSMSEAHDRRPGAICCDMRGPPSCSVIPAG